MVGQTSYDYSGESAIVTGSTSGIGLGIATALVNNGADIAINAPDEEAVRTTVDELRRSATGDVIGIMADVGEPADGERLVETAIDAFDEIDLLVNNAAVWPMEGSMVEASLEDWDDTMDVNVRAQFYLSKLVAEHMIEHDIRGSIVNTTSQTGDRRTGGRGLYGVSKTSINGLTWRMAHDLARHGIRMNAISTDVTETHQLRKEARRAAEDDPDRTPEDVLREWGAARPLDRLGQPSDLANAVLWLASEQANYVVGTIVRVSGGGNLE